MNLTLILLIEYCIITLILILLANSGIFTVSILEPYPFTVFYQLESNGLHFYQMRQCCLKNNYKK